MLNINLAKDKLASELLPSDIENLYIKLTNELIIYIKLLNKKDQISDKMFKSNVSKKLLLNDYKNAVNRVSLSLSNMKLTLKEILNNKSINDLNNTPIINSNYQEEEINTIESYVTLRKSIYSYIEYII